MVWGLHVVQKTHQASLAQMNTGVQLQVERSIMGVSDTGPDSAQWVWNSALLRWNILRRAHTPIPNSL